jgi:hypothetical protein
MAIIEMDLITIFVIVSCISFRISISMFLYLIAYITFYLVFYDRIGLEL